MQVLSSETTSIVVTRNFANGVSFHADGGDGTVDSGPVGRE